MATSARLMGGQSGPIYSGIIPGGQAIGGAAKPLRMPHAPPLHKLVRVLREAFAAGAVLTGVAAVVLPSPAWADGGRGGDGYSGFGSAAAGGDGGGGYTGESGQAGQNIGELSFSGGGGGGAGSGAGGLGGTNGSYGGGDGGMGGANGNGAGALSIDNAGFLPGGAGSAGGDASSGSGGGGGGGAGGYGAIVTGSASNTNSGFVAGGDGGDGGAALYANGGSGGDGGLGLLFTAGGASLTNSVSIVGGDGGNGGSGDQPEQVGGNGGAGGAAIVGSNLTIVNASSGQIRGGRGGAAGGGTNGALSSGQVSAGGVGIVGSDLTIVNSGTIAGGEDGDGTRVDAIQFTGGTNSLELQAGYVITGTVNATGGASNTLILGGDADAAFNVSRIGSGSGYLGFGAFEKTGASTWTLDSSTTELTPWTLSGGTLVVGEDGSLGEDSGVLTFNGGTLETSSGFATSRAITLAGAGTIQADTDSLPLELDGLISGPGSLAFTGEGTVVLNHANTYQNGTRIYNGDVDVEVSGALGTGPVIVDGSSSPSLPPILTFENGASAGNLSISNSNSGQTGFAGGATAGNATITNASGGLTVFYDTTSAGSASITNQAQGTTMFSEQSSAGSATVTNQSGGVLAILDVATAEGAKVVNQAGGIVDISQMTSGTSIGSLSGAGDVGLGGKALTLGALNQDDTISGKIVDGSLLGLLMGSSTGGSLVKVGSGTLTLNGANTYTGGTTVAAGTLEVGDADHSSASILGDVQVNAAGTLRGHGSIAGNVDSTGMVWPGGSIGTLTINGNYTQSPSGTLQVEVSPTAASQLKVGGTATLAGTLSLLYAPGTYTTKTYTLVSARSVNGAFSTVTGNAPAGVTQGITYASNAVGLSLTGSGSVQPVVVAPTQATIFGAVGSSALRAGQGVNEVLLDRLAGPCGVAASGASSRGAAGGSSAGTSSTASGQAAGTSGASGASGSAAQSLSCPRQGNGLWIQAQGTDTRIDGNHGAPDSRDRRYGFLTGVDHQWKGWTVGVAGGYSHADVTESGNGSKGTLDTLRIAGYGAKNLGAYTLAGTLGYAYDFSSTTRSFGALGSVKGDGHGQEFTAGLQASRPWSLGPVVLTPRVGVRYAYLDGLGTDETGPTAQNLGVANQHLQSLQPYVGVTLDYPFALRNSDRPASVQLRAGYAYETQSTGRNVSVTAADGTGFVIAGTRDTRGLVTAGLGATLPVGKSTSAYVRYDSVLHTGNVNAQSLQAGVDYRF